MATIEEVHRAFGNAAEAGQLLETQLANMMLSHHVIAENLIDLKSPKRAKELVDEINRHTVGQLLKKLQKTSPTAKSLEHQLEEALDERNRLVHQFFRYHNLRRGSDEGRDVMLKDLVSIHETLLEAYRALMMLDGVDLDEIVKRNAASAPAPILHAAQVEGSKPLSI